MTAAVEIIISQPDETLLVPNNGKSMVYRVGQDGKLEAIEVSLGVSSEKYSQVLDGNLSPGDLIVLNPHEL